MKITFITRDKIRWAAAHAALDAKAGRKTIWILPNDEIADFARKHLSAECAVIGADESMVTIEKHEAHLTGASIEYVGFDEASPLPPWSI